VFLEHKRSPRGEAGEGGEGGEEDEHGQNKRKTAGGHDMPIGLSLPLLEDLVAQSH
jgi:hypothetical protein